MGATSPPEETDVNATPTNTPRATSGLDIAEDKLEVVVDDPQSDAPNVDRAPAQPQPTDKQSSDKQPADKQPVDPHLAPKPDADSAPPAAAGQDPRPEPAANETLRQAFVNFWVRPTHWWAPVLAIYAVTRVLTYLITLGAARWQRPMMWTPANPDYYTFAGIWDGTWYRRIATQGYPSALPRNKAGDVLQNEWAFFPAYPKTVGFLMDLTGARFEVVGVWLNVALGVILALLTYRLFCTQATHLQSLLGVTFVLTFPTSPVLTYAYTETTALILLVLCLHLLQNRMYLWCLLPVAGLALSRPIALPFGLVVLAHLIYRWWTRNQDRLSVADGAKIIGLGLFAAFSSVAHPLFVGWYFGNFNTYNEIQSAWHSGNLGYVLPWFSAATKLFGPTLGPLAVIALFAALAYTVVRHGHRALGLEMNAWVAAYGLYLLVVLQPWTSLFRYWLLAFPLALLAAKGVKSLSHAGTWLWSMVSLQVVWVYWLWVVKPGGDFPP